MSDTKSRDGSAGAFSAMEEEFFRAGDAMTTASPAESWSEPEAVPVSRGLWSRLFKRTPRPATEPPVADEDWDWQIAITRARHSTSS